jgi:hypothetical protein
MKHKLLFILSIISVLALVVSSVNFSITKSKLEASQDEYITIKEKNKELVTDVDAEILRLKNQRDRANAKYKRISSAQAVSPIAADYYYCRYEFNGSPKDNKCRIISDIKSYTTKQFQDNLETELSRTAGNGNVSEIFRHSCLIESLFVSDIYQKNNDNLGKQSKINMLDVYARLRLNDKYDAISVLTFTFIQNEWRIMDERIVAMRFEEFKL